MSTTSEINKRNNSRIQTDRDEQSGFVGDPYFNAARQSLQSQFRFLLRIRGVPFAMVTNVSRPNPTFGPAKEFQLLNWKFKNPSGVVTWNPISFTIRETFDNSVVDSVAGIIMNKYKRLGYDNPNQVNPNNLKDMSKSSLMESMGDVIIQIIDPDGDVYEQWTLYDSFVSGISFSELNYSGGALLGTTLTITYDWATLTYVNQLGATKTY
jgi:hypothetical protein